MIGNPPYGASYPSCQKDYFKMHFESAKTKKGIQKGSLDTFTLFIEQGYYLLRKGGCFAYIVPISITSSDAMTGIQRLLLSNCSPIYISSYAVRPKPVFENAVVNTSIILMRKTLSKCEHLYATKMYRRSNGKFDLSYLINNLQYTDVKDYLLSGRIPKISLEIEKSILRKLFGLPRLSSYEDSEGSPIYYRTTGGRYFKIVTNYSTGSNKEKAIFFDKEYTDAIGCVLSSNLSFWFYQIYSNNLDWKSYEILSFVLPQTTRQQRDKIKTLYNTYLNDIESKANVRTTSKESRYTMKEFKEYKIVRSKSIIDEIDDYIGPLYGLNSEEIEFVKNYELRFRMSGE